MYQPYDTTIMDFSSSRPCYCFRPSIYTTSPHTRCTSCLQYYELIYTIPYPLAVICRFFCPSPTCLPVLWVCAESQAGVSPPRRSLPDTLIPLCITRLRKFCHDILFRGTQSPLQQKKLIYRHHTITRFPWPAVRCRPPMHQKKARCTIGRQNKVFFISQRDLRCILLKQRRNILTFYAVQWTQSCRMHRVLIATPIKSPVFENLHTDLGRRARMLKY